MIRKYQWLCHAYCLMDTHDHLLVEAPEGNLSLGMRQLNGVYTQRFNRRHRWPGHVFQGRFQGVLQRSLTRGGWPPKWIATEPCSRPTCAMGIR